MFWPSLSARLLAREKVWETSVRGIPLDSLARMNKLGRTREMLGRLARHLLGSYPTFPSALYGFHPTQHALVSAGDLLSR